MRPHQGLFAAIATMLAASPSYAYADPSAQQALQSVQYLVGTWNCAHTVGDFSGTYTTGFANALGNLWLRQTYDFPATKTEPAWHGEFFLGYDARVPRWVRFGALSTGQYFGMLSKTTSNTTWPWEYVLPGVTGRATWTKKSDAEFTVDGPDYTMNGKPVTEHHVCKKAQ
jgi:hypothetical protein